MNAKKSLLAAVIGFFLGSGGASNVVAEPDDKETSKTGVVIEEVIVTAEKRDQNVQDVPVAISAFSTDMLEARGIVTPQDLQFHVPTLSIAESHQGGAVKVFLRGVGIENVSLGGDPGVPIHINGHYTQSTAYILRDMLDVERVEVLRGPQGTLYGRNAIGGNINIVTKRPTETFERQLGIDVGNYNKRQVQAIVSGPLTESLRGRISLVDDKRDGYVENLGSGGDDRENSDYSSIRGALEYDLTDNVQLYLNAYYFDDKGANAVRILQEYPQTPTYLGGPNYWILNSAGSNPTASDPFKIRNNTPSEQTDKSKGVSLDLSWDLGPVEFRSLTAYDSTDRTSVNDLDGSDVVNIEESWIGGLDVWTQEFQLLSADTGSLKWVTGLFYYRENADLFYDFRTDSSVAVGNPRGRVILPVDLSATSMAAYGQLDYSVTDNLELVVGLRYTNDEKDRAEAIFVGVEDASPLFEIPGSAHDGGDNWSKVTGKLGLNYHLREEAMIYASWSRGYKSGGFKGTQGPSYDPEHLDAYEIGLKSQWLGRRVQLNLAAFYYDYQDKQDNQRIVTPEDLVIFHVRNASAATSKGVELEAQAFLTDAFLIDFSLGYLDAKYDEFTTIDGVFPQLGPQDLSGNQLPFSPEWSVHIGAQYEWALGADLGSLTARMDYNWVDDKWANGLHREADGVLVVGNGDLLPSSYTVNARLEWVSSGLDWRAELYGRNLTDEAIQTNAFLGAGTGFGTYMPPRTYGFKLQYSF